MKMATEDDILSLWSGLGYYRRASFIYQAKEKIFLDFNGRFPGTYDEADRGTFSQINSHYLPIVKADDTY